MIYATPEAFRQALEVRIRSAAGQRMQPITRVRQLLVFDRFLDRIFKVLGPRAILKGGAALELRLDRARTTRDIDLRVTGRPDDLLGALQEACALDRGDFLSFHIEIDSAHPTIDGDGVVYDGKRYKAEARLAGKIYGDRFGVDAGFGDVLTTAVDVCDGSGLLSFAGIARTTYRLYPREAHVAEKLHAYTLPRPRENTRVKDLPDIALLATTGPFDAATLREAVTKTFSFRNTHPLPERVPAPLTRWLEVYAEMAASDSLPWKDIDAVFAAASAFLDPILAADGGRWDPKRWAWY